MTIETCDKCSDSKERKTDERFIPEKQIISTALEGISVTLKGIPITYEHIKDGFRFYVWTEDRDKAVEIVKEIVAKIKSEHNDPKHFVTWQTVSIDVLE